MGWVASMIMGSGGGLIWDIVVGIIGSVLGGFAGAGGCLLAAAASGLVAVVCIGGGVVAITTDGVWMFWGFGTETGGALAVSSLILETHSFTC